MSAVNYKVPVPQSFLLEKVVIFLNIPMQGKTGPKGEPGIVFPSFEATIIQELDGALLIKDPQGEKILPFHQIQSILKPSAIQAVPSIVLPTRRN